MTQYLSVEEVIVINEEITGQQAVREIGLLESAVIRPMTTVFGQDAYTSIYEKAAALLHSLSHNHPFVDGNKRTATIATLLFLKRNGLQRAWSEGEALAFILDVAQGRFTILEIAAWLEKHTSPISHNHSE